jgi:crossover junction endodeoxyribonuclease RusA
VIKLILPYPISANRYWRSFVPKGWNHAIVHPSDEAKLYKRDIGWLAAKQGIKKPITGPVEVTLELYPHRPQDWAKRAKVDPLWWDLSVQCIDLDNARKVLWDALKGIAFTDDKMIRKDPGEIMIPDGEARVVVTVKPYERAHPQAVLFGGDYKPAEHQGQPDGRNWRERVEEARYPF